MELVPNKDVYDNSKRDTKKRFLVTDSICVTCGAIINSNYEKDCIICDDGHKICDHNDFITGRQSVDLRILLDFHIDDLKALAELNGCSEGSGRTKIVSGLMKKLHSNLDNRIDEILIRKIILRNRKRFWFWKDIDSEMKKVSKPIGKPKGIRLIRQKECISTKITVKNKDSKGDNIINVTVIPMGNHGN